MRVDPGGLVGCQPAECIPIRATVTNRGFRHAYLRCDVIVIDARRNTVADVPVIWYEIPIGQEIPPFRTVRGIQGRLLVKAPAGPLSLVPHCRAIYLHGPPPV